MFPYITIFNRSIPLYSVAAGIGICLSVAYLKMQLKSNSHLRPDMELAFTYSLVSAMLGAKILWLIVSWDEFILELPYVYINTKAFFEKYIYSGFVFYGGLFGSILSVWLYCRFCKLDLSQTFQILVPTLPLIHAFGRLGCFCMGCCYGRDAMDGEWGITFHNSLIAPNDIALIPVQLYESILEFFLFVLLAGMAKHRKDGRTILSVYLIVYGTLRFILEFYRGDSYRGSIGVFSVSQVISIISLFVGLISLWLRMLKYRNG